MKHAYIINDENELLGSTIFNDDEEIPEGFVVLPVPEYKRDVEIPVWRNDSWQIELTKEGQIGLFAQARSKRNSLLSNTDWTQLPDVTITDANREAMKIYRQILRDVFNDITDPRLIVWPDIPVLSV